MKDILEVSKNYAITTHKRVNQFYGDYPYEYHLKSVYEIGKKFLYLIPEKHINNVLSACWLHDIIEDGRETYNDVKKQTNVEIAELVFALTNEKGRTRKDRANDKYYEGIRNTKFATFVKIADRIANIEFSKKQKNNKMYKMYCRENNTFIEKIFDYKYQVMIDYLRKLC